MPKTRIWCLLQKGSYEEVVKAAISFGDDTNVTVAGGLAGIRFGVKGIPTKWMDALRGKELTAPLPDLLDIL